MWNSNFNKSPEKKKGYSQPNPIGLHNVRHYGIIARCECVKEVDDGSCFIFASSWIYWMGW